MIDRDEYREVTCSLTGKGCSWGDCSTCEDALDDAHDERMREHDRLIPRNITKKNDFFYSINDRRTVASFSLEISVEKVIEIFKLPNSSEVSVRYDMTRLLKRWPQFVKMKSVMSLGIPLKLIEASNFLFAYYEDKFFVISPMLTNEEFENSG